MLRAISKSMPESFPNHCTSVAALDSVSWAEIRKSTLGPVFDSYSVFGLWMDSGTHQADKTLPNQRPAIGLKPVSMRTHSDALQSQNQTRWSARRFEKTVTLR